MRLHVVNPNTTASMTAKIAAAARRAAAPGTVVVASNPASGPPAIEGPLDGARAVPGMLDCIADADAEGADAHIIACFDDTGLDAARALSDRPVVGIGEAAELLASLVGRRFAVVTMAAVSVPVLEGNLARLGLASRCTGIHPTGFPVLSLERGDPAPRAAISAAIARALREERAEVIALGCAGMADLADALSAEHGVPVVEGVAAAVKLAESLVALRLTTSKAGGWASPSSRSLAARSG